MYQRYEQLIRTETQREVKSSTYNKGPETCRELDVFSLEPAPTDGPIELEQNQQLISNLELGPVAKVEILPQGYLLFEPSADVYFIPKAWITLGLINSIVGKTLVIVRDMTISSNVQVMDLEDWTQILSTYPQKEVLGNLNDFEDWIEGATYEAIASLPNHRCNRIQFQVLKTFIVDSENTSKDCSLLNVLKSSIRDMGLDPGCQDLSTLRNVLLFSQYNLADFQVSMLSPAKKVSSSRIMEAIVRSISSETLQELSGNQSWVPVSKLSTLNAIPTGLLSLKYKGQTLLGSLRVEAVSMYNTKQNHYVLSLDDDPQSKSTISFPLYVEFLRSILELGDSAVEQTLPSLHNIQGLQDFKLHCVRRFLNKIDTDRNKPLKKHQDTLYVDPSILSDLANYPPVLNNWQLADCSIFDVYRLLAALLPQCEVRITEAYNLTFLN